LFFRWAAKLGLLSENKKNIHELFEESSLADYTLDEGCQDVLVLKILLLIWHPPCWTFLEEASNISPGPSYLIPKV
jgi:hypothetical protein